MLDIELITSDPGYVRTALLKRADDVDLDPILEADALRRKLTTEVDTARSERNRQAKEIGKLKSSGADTTEAQKQAPALGDQVNAMQAALTEAEKTLHDLLMGSGSRPLASTRRSRQPPGRVTTRPGGPTSGTGPRRASRPPTSTRSMLPAWPPAAFCLPSLSSTSNPMARSSFPNRCAPGSAPTSSARSINP